MAKCHQNNVDSLILHRIPSASSSTFGNVFSGSTFRRIIFDAISCGGSSRFRRNLREEEADDEDKTDSTKTNIATSNPKSATIGEENLSPDGFVKEPEKTLCDLLNATEMETGVETETKEEEETMVIMNRVVRDLQSECGDDGGKKIAAAASEVRLLAKDDTEARVTLAMLGAIPPLVNMIDDSPTEDAQIASLYALLNLGIGNDA